MFDKDNNYPENSCDYRVLQVKDSRAFQWAYFGAGAACIDAVSIAHSG